MEIIIDHKPTIKEMDEISFRHYYNFNGNHYVRAYLEDNESVFACPWCWSSYNKDGQQSKRGKFTLHKHGADLGISHRCSHCSKHPDGYYICITRKLNGDLVGA